jgi:hypothetical protein
MHQTTADKGASTSAAGEKRSATQTTTGVHASKLGVGRVETERPPSQQCGACQACRGDDDRRRAACGRWLLLEAALLPFHLEEEVQQRRGRLMGARPVLHRRLAAAGTGVGHLRGGKQQVDQMSMLVSRAATNIPLLGIIKISPEKRIFFVRTLVVKVHLGYST